MIFHDIGIIQIHLNVICFDHCLVISRMFKEQKPFQNIMSAPAPVPGNVLAPSGWRAGGENW